MIEIEKPIYFFRKTDPCFELSNLYPVGFEEDGLSWPSVEHYFQAQKFEDSEYRERIRTCESPQLAKTLGQSRKYTLREDWEWVKEDVMLSALRKKFSHPQLRTVLLETGTRVLVENSPNDKYWGIGRDGKGQNKLGRLLMQVRSEIDKSR